MAAGTLFRVAGYLDTPPKTIPGCNNVTEVVQDGNGCPRVCLLFV
jgi:hypothetical protein